MILTERDVNMYSPLTLAFLGDSVYDTLVREKLLRSANMPAAKLHSAKIKLVCAEFQSKAYDAISEVLTEKEMAVLKRGRNATGNNIPKHAEAAEYRRATAVECLFGYLYLLGNMDRIAELFAAAMQGVNIDEIIGN
ncbi:MAG: ribonuclease III [Ruminococcus sp.]|nr:ribonuclease III [Ruminococcus sp.]MBQ9139633.1 ribonuclease III [Ruminococcus sp.]